MTNWMQEEATAKQAKQDRIRAKVAKQVAADKIQAEADAVARAEAESARKIRSAKIVADSNALWAEQNPEAVKAEAEAKAKKVARAEARAIKASRTAEIIQGEIDSLMDQIEGQAEDGLCGDTNDHGEYMDDSNRLWGQVDRLERELSRKR